MSKLSAYAQKITDQGYHAGRNGLPKSDNPYAGKDCEYELCWNLGYDRGAEVFSRTRHRDLARQS